MIRPVYFSRLSLFFISVALLSGCACPGGKEYHSVDGERVSEIKRALSEMTSQQLDDFIKDFQISKEFLPQQVIVKFANGTSLSKVQETLGAVGAIQSYEFKSTKALLVKVPDAISKADVLAIVTALNEIKSVDYAVPNGLLKISAIPNDPTYRDQDDLNNTGQRGGTVGADIRAEGAWEVTRGSTDVVVGIIDSGIDYTHPDLIDNIWNNPGETGTDTEGHNKATNGIDDDGNGYVDDLHGYDFVNNDNEPFDDHGHGTHVAGTIGARGNNGIGMTGINWQVKLAALKFIAADGSGTDADAIRAIEYATQMNIPITNSSWGGLGYNQATKDAIEAAGKKGFLFVAAAGNNSVDNDIIQFFPANYELDNIISVAAVDNKDAKPDFSNWGARKVHIAAPGVDILSLAVTGSPAPFVRWSGTSMAAPHVTGAAALIKAAYPQSDYKAMKNRILFGADTLQALLNPTYSYTNWRPDEFPIDKPLVRGGKRLNLEKSLESDTVAPGSVTGLRVSFAGLTQLEVRFQPAGDDGASGQASSYIAVTSAAPITSETAWANQAQKVLSPVQVQTDGLLGARLEDLEFLQSGYLTLRAVDNVGNLGPMTASIPFEMSNPTTLFLSDGESKENMIFKHMFSYSFGFEQEEVPGRGKVWSDSPYGGRDYNYKYMEFTQNTEIPHPDVVLQFDTKFDCAAVYERGMVEIRINEETDPFSTYAVWNPDRGAYDWFNSPKWRMLAVYSAAKCDWAKVTIPLGNKVKKGDRVRVRFFLRAGGDPADGHDGWLIDDIKILGPGSPAKPSQLVAAPEFEGGAYTLRWTDTSQGETRFEVRSTALISSGALGTLVAEIPVNTTQYSTGQTTADPNWRVRACNGILCSELSDPVQVLAAPPRVDSISPRTSPLAGGQTLTVTGAGFLPGAIVRIHGVDCPNSVRVSETQMTCQPAARTAGTYNVAVINTDAQRGVLAAAYTYQAAPTPVSISPVSGPLAGGNTLTVTGTGFLPGALVRIHGIACPNSVRVSETQMTCQPAARTAGTYNVAVINTDTQRGVLVAAYTYQAAPTITSLTPSRGRISGGEVVTLTGTGFLAGATVQIGSQGCGNATLLSSTQIRCVAAPNSQGSHHVRVTNLDGQISSHGTGTGFTVITPRWVATRGEACSTVCSREGLFSRLSPEGSYCTSGEQIPPSAVRKVPYVYGCWPFRDCRSQGTRSTVQVGQHCYGAGQRRDKGRTDITVGCYCDL